MNRLGVSVTSFFRACLYVALFSWVSAWAQADYPRQPIRMVSDLPPGAFRMCWHEPLLPKFR